MTANPVTRAIRVDDAPALSALVTANRAFLAPWDPVRDDEFFTVEGQAAMVTDLLESSAAGTTSAHVILDASGAVRGQVTLYNIARRSLQSCGLGYWLDEAANGHGLATRAVAAMVDLAFGDLGLHRVEAGTLLHNVRSQAVLRRNGFVPYGVAPEYLRIAGRWQDHVLYQRINPAG